MSKTNFTPKNGEREKLSRFLGYDAFFVNPLLARNAVIPLHTPFTKATSKFLIGCLSIVLFLFSMQNTFAEKFSAIAVSTVDQKMNAENLPASDCLVYSKEYMAVEFDHKMQMLQSHLNEIVFSSCLTSQNDFISKDVKYFYQSNCPNKLNFDADIYIFECKTDIQNELFFLNFK